MRKALEILANCWLKAGHVILDTETTGLGEEAEIVEISIIDTQGQVLLDTLVKPVRPIPEDATAIHGITNEMVAGAPTWPEVQGQVMNVIGDNILLIYNAAYDVRMLYQAMAAHNLDSKAFKQQLERSDCIMLAYAEFFSEWDDRHSAWKWQRLTNAAAQQGVELSGKAHRALADCQMTLGIIASMAGQWCTTMQRLKSACRCPDCGSSLVQEG